MAVELNTKWLSTPAQTRASDPAARELLRHAADTGADPDALVRRAGLAHPAAAILDPAWPGRLSRAEFARLYAECTWAIDDHASRQEGRLPLSKGEHDLLCHCVITCRTLRDAVERVSAFSAMLMPRTARLTLEVKDGVAELRMATVRSVRNVSAYISDLTGLSSHLRLFGWLIGEEIAPLSVALRYPPLVGPEIDIRLMRHGVVHGAPENALRFAERYLSRPVVRTPGELDRLLRRFPFDLDEVQSTDAPLSEHVRVALRSALADGVPLPGGAALARQFSLSPATLKRRLREEGLPFSALKAGCRLDLARALLLDPRRSIAEVAGRIGFGDAPTFSRAFRSWTGLAPGRWRAAARAGGGKADVSRGCAGQQRRGTGG